MNRRTSSISPPSMNEPARCGPPSSRMRRDGRVEGAELVERGAARAPGSFSPVATTTSAPAVSSASVALRGAARETTTTSGTSGASETSFESSGSRAVESNTTRRGWRWTPGDARGELRVVGERGADPDRDGVERRAPAVRDARGCPRSRSTSSRRVWVATLPSRLIADLKSDPRAPGAGVLAEGLVLQPGARGELAARRRRPRCPRRAGSRGRGRRPSRSGRRRRRRRGSMPAARIASVHGGWLAVVAARLERDVQRRAAQVGVAAVGDRVDLRVRPAVLVVPALAEHGAVADDDGADDGVGARAAEPAARRGRSPGRGGGGRCPCAARLRV